MCCDAALSFDSFPLSRSTQNTHFGQCNAQGHGRSQMIEIGLMPCSESTVTAAGHSHTSDTLCAAARAVLLKAWPAVAIRRLAPRHSMISGLE